jgi:HlyD family secretion protein
VELEASRLQDDLVEQQIREQNAEAAFIRARENLKVVKNQTTSDISRAKLDYEFAQEDLKQYVEGEYPQQLRESESRITLAREEHERAQDKLTWSERLYEGNYISQIERETDRLTCKRAELDHELAIASRKLLEDYTHQRQLAQLQSDIEQAEMALERVTLKGGADIVQAQADLNAKEAESRQQQSKLEKVERQISKTKIYAPRAGLVVYATSATSSRHGNDEPLDEGQSVRERQELIHLPTADEMLAQLQIHESNLDKVRVGLPVRVTVDALKGKTFIGHIAKIAPLPNAYRMRWNPDLKLFETEVRLDGKHRELRTGMSCQAEIVIDQYDDAIYAPVQAVIREGRQTVAYVRHIGELERRPVEIGLDNNRMVRIVSGLEGGELVVLTPPLEASPELAEEQVVDSAESEEFKRRIEESKNNISPQPQREPRARRERGEEGRGEEGHGERGRGAGVREDAPRDGRGGDRGRFGNMSPEEREAMRKRFENMTPEEREAARERMRQMRQGNQRPDEG